MGIRKVGSNRPLVAVNPNGTVAGFFQKGNQAGKANWFKRKTTFV